MSGGDEPIGQGAFSSPPCFMHELDGSEPARSVDQSQQRDVARWRKAMREQLISARLAISPEERAAHSERVAQDLDVILQDRSNGIVSLYWPFRGEPDLRPWMREVCARGWRAALPVVVTKGQPLSFREWTPNCRLERGIWNIPYPADGAIVAPSVVIAPLVGFDPHGFRLGYGGGYFDRTLAAMTEKPLVIGVGHLVAALETIYPQPHDIAMDMIAVGDGRPRASAGRGVVP